MHRHALRLDALQRGSASDEERRSPLAALQIMGHDRLAERARGRSGGGHTLRENAAPPEADNFERSIVALGWVVYALAYLGFALASAPWMIWVLYAFYGLFYALSEGAGKAMVSELVPEATRGTAFGLYNAAVGVMALPASLIAGALWQRVSPAAPFAFGAAMAGLALIGLRLVPQTLPDASV